MPGEMTVSEAGASGGRARGVRNSGERNPKSKLTWAAVAEIRREPGTPAQELATRFGVHVNTVRAVRRGATWKRR